MNLIPGINIIQSIFYQNQERFRSCLVGNVFSQKYSLEDMCLPRAVTKNYCRLHIVKW